METLLLEGRLSDWATCIRTGPLSAPPMRAAQSFMPAVQGWSVQPGTPRLASVPCPLWRPTARMGHTVGRGLSDAVPE